MGSIIKHRIAGTARESVEDSVYTSKRTDGIKTPKEWEPNIPANARTAERYASGRIPGINIGGRSPKHGA